MKRSEMVKYPIDQADKYREVTPETLKGISLLNFLEVSRWFLDKFEKQGMLPPPYRGISEVHKEKKSITIDLIYGWEPEDE
jgi:hypothetical protein